MNSKNKKSKVLKNQQANSYTFKKAENCKKNALKIWMP